MRSPVLVVDIETIPNPELIGPDFDPTVFPALPFHKVVCIGALRAQKIQGHTSRWEPMQCDCIGDPEDSEAELIKKFWAYLDSSKPTLITYNGRGFDVPALIVRSTALGIPTAGCWTHNRYENYLYRYGDRHMDLMDQLSNYGAARNIALDAMARACGYPGKIGGHGSEVSKQLAEEGIQAVRDYCLGDVLNTYGIFLNYLRTMGESTAASWSANRNALHRFVNQADAKKPLKDYAQSWNYEPVPIEEDPIEPSDAADQNSDIALHVETKKLSF